MNVVPFGEFVPPVAGSYPYVPIGGASSVAVGMLATVPVPPMIDMTLPNVPVLLLPVSLSLLPISVVPTRPSENVTTGFGAPPLP